MDHVMKRLTINTYELAAKIGTDNGQAFGPVLKSGTNGTIAEAEEGGINTTLYFLLTTYSQSSNIIVHQIILVIEDRSM